MATPPGDPVHAPVLELAMSGLLTRALFTVTERGVPDLLAEGPLDSAEIAGKCGAHPAAMHQVLRALAGAGYFRTGANGRFGLTPLGETLCAGHPSAARDLVLIMGGPSVHGALGRSPETVDGVPGGADAYLLSRIVHDWDEAACRTILGHCRDALAPDGRVLIVEMVLPEGDEPHPGKILDLAMLALAGGRERTGEEYRELLAGVGLELTRIVPTASAASVVEAVRAG